MGLIKVWDGFCLEHDFRLINDEFIQFSHLFDSCWSGDVCPASAVLRVRVSRPLFTCHKPLAGHVSLRIIVQHVAEKPLPVSLRQECCEEPGQLKSVNKLIIISLENMVSTRTVLLTPSASTGVHLQCSCLQLSKWSKVCFLL